jgi:hypothetical protein
LALDPGARDATLQLCSSSNSGDNFCCGQSETCCGNSSAIFSIALWSTLARPPGSPATTSSSATVSTSSPTLPSLSSTLPSSIGTSQPADSNKSLSLGLGLGVGLPLGLAIIVLLAFVGWELRKHNRMQQSRDSNTIRQVADDPQYPDIPRMGHVEPKTVAELPEAIPELPNVGASI